ncbi:GGDEF domain-containing protein [Halomonas vilamensis]|uniref:diguanylate cyclase n=1 Tax=Vreelandella vilamensis TaxID=531309 RepID=A0ABU1H149_9GAMM|nr:GGDEF domain-containing protein [Halomonas vilamensis]MDR5897387.1 GGDEF domain-containing protein [Halomonas vilamensis]
MPSPMTAHSDRRSDPSIAKPGESSWLSNTLSALSDTFTNRHHSRDFVFAHGHFLRSRVMAVGFIFLLLSPLWLLIDALMLPPSVQRYTLAGRVVMMLGFAAVVWWAWRSEENIRRIRFSAGALIALPALFYALVLNILPSSANQALVGYGFIPFLLVAALSVFPFTLLESLLAGILLQALLVFAQHVNGSWMTPAGLEAQWLLATLLIVALTANHFQLSLLLRLYRQATHDALTGLLNRGAMERRLAEIEREEARTGKRVPYALLMLDIDHFKRVNDTYGHSVGDKVLREFARLIALQVRAGDFVARYGGEEFVVALLGADAENAAYVAERIREAVEGATLFDHDGNPVPVTTSVGVACPETSLGSEATLKIADDRLYHAKESGRNRVCSG